MCTTKPIIFTIYPFSKNKIKMLILHLMLGILNWMFYIRPADMSREKMPGKFTRNVHRPADCSYPFHQHSTDQNSVTWPHLTKKEARIHG